MLLFLAVSGLAKAQVLIPPEDLSAITAARRVFEQARGKKSLPCYVEIRKSRTDVLFRRTAYFSIEYPLSRQHNARPLIAFVRVTPEKRAPIVLMETFSLSQAEAKVKQLWSQGMGARISLVGEFATGPGRYSVEVVLTDQEDHYCRKVAHVKVGANAGPIQSPLAAGTVAQAVKEIWNGKLNNDGHRLTVFLDTDTLGGGTLSPNNRVYLLRFLALLLGQVRCRSVKVVAFNLDQQLEVFRREQFDSAGFLELGKTLEQFQPGAVSYAALQTGRWQDFLLKLLQNEWATSNRSDVVVFLGPATYGEKPSENVTKVLHTLQTDDIRVFYLRLLGSSQGMSNYEVNGKSHGNNPRLHISFRDTPDRIQDFVRLLQGKTFDVDTFPPLDLLAGYPNFRDPISEAIAKLLKETGADTKKVPSSFGPNVR